ncbi:YhgE/Pip family protein [Salinithrix halophila]|uniref:YhgE/Pip family protein n=1 Tax=Salinithrix halophila TaxID=1485204 RepID=A0ABV8JE41_9BACL
MKRRKETLALYEIWRHRPLIIVLLGILMVPLVYSVLYLTAFYNPYGKMDNLPVAVVNEDRGATVDGEKINVGDELVANMKEDPKLQWIFVSRDEMKKGFKENRYYLGIVIPEEFSERAASVKNRHPQKGHIQYYANEGSNYLSSQMGKRVIQSLQDEVERNLTKTYAQGIFDKLSKSTTDLAKASNGADQLEGATKKAAGAAGKLEKGTSTIQGGVNQLGQAIGQLQTGAGKLVQGQQKVKNVIGQLADGSSRVTQGIGTMREEVKEKGQDLPQLKSIAEQVQQGIGEIRNKLANPKLSEGAAFISDLARRIQAGSGKTDEAYNRLLEKHPELKDDPDMQRLKGALDQQRAEHQNLLNRAVSLENDLKKARSDVDRMYKGQSIVIGGLGQIQTGFDKQIAAFDQLQAGSSKVTDGLNQVNTALSNLLTGAQRLKGGLDQLAQAPGKLSNGLSKLDGGMQKLGDGLQKIWDGQGTLADKLAQGVNDAKDQLMGKDKKADQIANPVAVDKDTVSEVPNYATGFAPYFISLSLWVGAMILFTVLDLKRPILGNHQPLSIPSALAVGAMQAILLVAALIHLVGIRPELTGWLYLFSVLTAFTFTAINHMLVTLFKDVGRFLAIVILMLQLTSSAGTYPVEMLPSFFQDIHPYLPMSYSVEGLRAAISTGDTSLLLHHSGVLLGYLVGAYLLKEGFSFIWGRWISPRIRTSQ